MREMLSECERKCEMIELTIAVYSTERAMRLRRGMITVAIFNSHLYYLYPASMHYSSLPTCLLSTAFHKSDHDREIFMGKRITALFPSSMTILGSTRSNLAQIFSITILTSFPRASSQPNEKRGREKERKSRRNFLSVILLCVFSVLARIYVSDRKRVVAAIIEL
jgi:hypothetical protein